MINKLLADLDIRFNQVIDIEKDTVFVSGSVIEGFGNDKSDLDIYIISDNQSVQQVFIPIDLGKKIDIVILTHEEIQEIGSKINQTSPNSYDEVYLVSSDYLIHYYFTAIAEPIVNPKILYSLQSDFRKEIVARLLESYYGLWCQKTLAQANFALQENDLEAAYFSVQIAIGFAIDSFLAAHGESYPRRKFRFDKIARAFGKSSDIFCKAWKLRSLGKTDFMSYIQDGKQFCSELGMDRFPKTNIDTLRFRREPNVRMIDVIDHFYLVYKQEYIYNLSAQAGYLWSIIDGKRTKDELASHLAKKFDLESEHATSLASECLWTLQMHGLVELA